MEWHYKNAHSHTTTPYPPLPLQISTPYLGLHSPNTGPTPVLELPTPLTSKKRNDWIWSTSAGLRLRRLRTGGSWVVLHYTCREQLAPHQRCNCPLRLETKELCPLQTAIVVWFHSKLGLYSATLSSTPYLIIIHTKVKRGREIRRGATPNSAPIQHLARHERERIPRILSHVTR